MSYYAQINHCEGSIWVQNQNLWTKPGLWWRSEVPNSKNKNLGQQSSFQKVWKILLSLKMKMMGSNPGYLLKSFLLHLMEWLSNVTNQMDSFGLMANDIGLDSCHLEAVDESHNENRDWSGAIKDWHLASEAEMQPRILPRPLHSVRIRKKKFKYYFFI